MANIETKFAVKLLPEDVGGKPRTVIFHLGNGSKLSLSLDELSPEMVERLAIHGLSQKGGDSYSNMSKTRDFAGAYGALQSTLDNLRNGLWSSRTGGNTADLVVAMAKILGIELEEAQAKVDQASDEQLAAVRKNPQVKLAIAKIQEARAKEAAKAAPDLGTLLGSIGL
jgi:hypothetical protein